MPDYTLLPFSHIFYLKISFIDLGSKYLTSAIIPRPYLFVSTASLSPLVRGQNGIEVLGLWIFVLEEFGDNVPNYISSLDIYYYTQWSFLRKSQLSILEIPHFHVSSVDFVDCLIVYNSWGKRNLRLRDFCRAGCEFEKRREARDD